MFVLSDISNIDLRMSDTYYKNITENTAFTFSNKPRRTMTKTIRVIIDRAEDYAVIWPNDVIWDSRITGSMTSLSLNDNNNIIFYFITIDDGTTWYDTKIIERTYQQPVS